ncbi:MAG: polyprenyl synthetase family protein [Nitrospinota bacterium]|nr:polyprenyl synthetase family protein [Nitrospinota bacterium]
MIFSEIINSLSADLEEVEKEIKKNFHSDVVLIPDVSEYLSSSGGKRIRPLLLLLSSRACGYKGEKTIKHCCVVEFIHTATLLHDDVVDDADVRRGNPSANSKWGNEASVLVGDFLFAKSFELMSSEEDLRIMKTMSEACTLLSEGEVLQLINLYNVDVTEEEYLKVVYRKTAALIAASCKLGAILSGSPDHIIEALNTYGMNIGYSFQLIDDALDYMGDENKTGKKIGSDLLDGNITLPLLHLLLRVDGIRKERLKKIILESDELHEENLNFILELMEECGSVSYTRNLARHYAEEAKSSLSVIERSEHLDSLKYMADFIVDRNF